MGRAIDLDHVQAAGAGHVDVHQHDVEAAVLQGIEGLVAVLDQPALVPGPFQDPGRDLAVDRIVLGHQHREPPARPRHRRMARLLGERIAPRRIEAAQRMGGTGQRRRLDRQIEDGRGSRVPAPPSPPARPTNSRSSTGANSASGSRRFSSSRKRSRRLRQGAGVEQQRMIAVAGIAPRRERAAQLGQARGFDQRRCRPGPGPAGWRGRGRASRESRMSWKGSPFAVSALSAGVRDGPGRVSKGSMTQKRLPCLRLALEPDLAAHELCQLAHDGEAEARCPRSGGWWRHRPG